MTTVVRNRRGPKGKHNEPGPILDSIPIEACQVYPRYSTEESGRSGTVIVGMTVVAPPGSDILERDEIVWCGNSYDVEGQPGPWTYFDGDPAGLEVALVRGIG